MRERDSLTARQWGQSCLLTCCWQVCGRGGGEGVCGEGWSIACQQSIEVLRGGWMTCWDALWEHRSKKQKQNRSIVNKSVSSKKGNVTEVEAYIQQGPKEGDVLWTERKIKQQLITVDVSMLRDISRGSSVCNERAASSPDGCQSHQRAAACVCVPRAYCLTLSTFATMVTPSNRSCWGCCAVLMGGAAQVALCHLLCIHLTLHWTACFFSFCFL